MPAKIKFKSPLRRNRNKRRLFAAFAAGALFAAPFTAAAAADKSGAQSFYGAYLAGSYAADTGSPQASAYLRRALSFRPQDKIVRRELLFSLIEEGDYSGAVRLANTMRDDKDAAAAPIVRLVLAAEALKKQQYARVNSALGSAPNKDESLLWTFMAAWADFGRGQKSKALQSLSQARYSEWYAFLSAYHTALMLDLSNNPKQAALNYQNTAQFRALAEMAPEAYEHLLWAYAGFAQRIAGKQAALNALAQTAANLPKDNLVLEALRSALAQGKTIPRLVNTPAQGAAEFAYDIGSAFLRAGEDLYADIYLQTALYLRPGNDAALFRLGLLASRAKNLRKAEQFFAQIPQNSLYYSDTQMLTALGINQSLAADKNKKTDNAAAAAKLEKLIAKANSFDKTPLQNILANIYLQADRYSAALAVLNSLIAPIKQPVKENWSIYFQRAIVYERLKQWDKAEADFQEALKLNPNNADVMNYYGYSLIDRDLNLERGLDLVRRAAALQPQNGAVIDSLGWAYYKLGRYDEALAALEKAVQLEPGDSSINDHLGDAYWQTGSKLAAVFQWNHALAYDPEPQEAEKIRAKLKYGLREAAETGEHAANAAPAEQP